MPHTRKWLHTLPQPLDFRVVENPGLCDPGEQYSVTSGDWSGTFSSAELLMSIAAALTIHAHPLGYDNATLSRKQEYQRQEAEERRFVARVARQKRQRRSKRASK